MSRLIVRNLSKHLNKNDIIKHFKDEGQITDCKIIKKEDKLSVRQIAYLGFKEKGLEVKIKNKYDKTFMGVSKIFVEVDKRKK